MPNSVDNATLSRAALCPIYLRLPVENIARLKFTLESYEHLGVLRTLSSDAGEVVILALSDTEKTVLELLKELEHDLALRVIPPPASIADDWLLSEEA